MKLMSIKGFQNQYFAKGEAPALNTIKRWIEQGTIDGRKVGGKYFVNVQAFELTDNELVNSVLAS